MPLALHMQVFTRFVEVGRVALISYGPDEGKLCTIVNVIDHNRVLVDGPAVATGVHRHAIGIKRLMLTDLTVGCKLNATEKNLKKCWEAEGTLAKWEASSWAKKRKVQAPENPTTLTLTLALALTLPLTLIPTPNRSPNSALTLALTRRTRSARPPPTSIASVSWWRRRSARRRAPRPASRLVSTRRQSGPTKGGPHPSASRARRAGRP